MNFARVGDKYLSNDGKLLRIYNFPTASLVADICVANDAVYNLATGKKIRKFSATGDWFAGDNALNIIDGSELSSFTIVMIAEKPFSEQYINYFAVNGHKMYPIRFQYSNPSRWMDYDLELSPTMYFGVEEAYTATVSPKLLTSDADEFLAYARDAAAKTIRIRQNEVQSAETYADDLAALNSIILFPGRKYRRFMVYAGALTDAEIEQIYELRYGKNDTLYAPAAYAQGIDTLGCPNGFYARSSAPPEWADGVDYHAIPQAEPDATEDMSGFTALYYINPINRLEVGKKYNLEAHPYPYDVTTTPYNIEYSSDNPTVLGCYKGFLIARAPGMATITARISNTDISATLTISVVEQVAQEERYYKCPRTYTDGDSALMSDDPEMVLRAMVSAIYYAASVGYNGIRFPKRTYHIKPWQKAAHCNVPSNFTIDFNGATIFVDDNELAHCEAGAVDQSDGYTLFRFGEGDYNNYYGNPCEYSTIRNAQVFGERLNTERAENEFTEFTRFATFGCRSVGCVLDNIRFEATCGFNVDTETNGYNYFSGTALDGARRGCTLAEDYAEGRIAADGATITDEGGWYYTTDYIKIGYTHGTGDYTSILRYKVGLMGYMTYGTTGRWYDIFFYDADYRLIHAGLRQFGLEPYDFPEKAVYMKINIMTNSVPTTNTTTDVPAVVRVYPAVEPDLWEIRNCQFFNPHASAISVTGGVRGIIDNCYAEEGKRYGWSIDFEDGWLAMRHNMIYRLLCGGSVIFPAGHNTAVVHSAIGMCQCLGDTENLRHINSYYGVLRIKPKTNDVVECCTFGGTYPVRYTYPGVSTLRRINNTGGPGNDAE